MKHSQSQSWSYNGVEAIQPANKLASDHCLIEPYLPLETAQNYVNSSHQQTMQYFNGAQSTGMISKPENKTPEIQDLSAVHTPSIFTNYTNSQVGANCDSMNHISHVQPQHQISHIQVQSSNQGYKFTTPTTPTIKFTTTHSPNEGNKMKSGRGRPRSRSNTREPLNKPPPLLAANSDPNLMSNTSSALLSQLLTSTDASQAIHSQRHNRDFKQEDSFRFTALKQNSPIPIVPQGSAQPALIISPITMSVQDPLVLSASPSPILDNPSLNSPTSSQSSFGSPTRDGKDQRRAGHTHAEQKRRYNIKNGFDMIHQLIPHLAKNPNTKLSKAAMLQKGAEYIRQLRAERNTLKEEMDQLRQQIDLLNSQISNCQSMLPATGAPVSRRKDNKIHEMFNEYVRTRTVQDWKFWIFSLFFRPLIDSFNNSVSTSSMEDLYRSTMLWIEQHCTLVDLRPIVLNAMRYISANTEILTDPSKLPDEARMAALSNSIENSNNIGPRS